MEVARWGVRSGESVGAWSVGPGLQGLGFAGWLLTLFVVGDIVADGALEAGAGGGVIMQRLDLG
jgi:hypothetical protein